MIKHVLVTGGCGFIGSHLVDSLQKQGIVVHVLDNFSTGKRSNIAADTQIVTGDVSDSVAVKAAMSGMDACFHLAAIASVTRSTADWIGTSRVNFGGTLNVLDAARTAKEGAAPIPVVFASSAAVYGNSAASPLSETAETSPLSAYGADKRACELHAFVATRVHGVPCIGLRFFNVYGPRQDPASVYSGVISRFAEAIFRAAPVEIHGDGEQVRDFVFVEDVVAALLQAMRAAPGLAPAVFNVCTGRATSIRTLAEVMHSAASAPAQIDFRPARLGDIRVSVGDPSKIGDAFGWRPAMSLQNGLRKTLAWYREMTQQ